MLGRILVPLIACATFTATAKQNAPKPTAKNVLLAFEQTNFKKRLVDAMEKQLKSDSIKVVVVEHSKGALDQHSADSYDAVFITNSGVHSTVRPWISEWLKKNEQASAKILLHTTQTRKWDVVAPVDAVTSASAVGEVGKLATEYTSRIRAILTSAQTEKSDAATEE